jgi:hypothetical protein
VLDLHGSRDISLGEVEGANLESGVIVGGIVGGIVGHGVGEESEEGVVVESEEAPSLGSKVFAAQSITGLTRSRKGMPRIMA